MFEQQQQQMPVPKDQKSILPLLMEELTQVERAVLGQTVNSPGWRVVVKLFDAVCTQANNSVIAVDREAPNAKDIVFDRQQVAHTASLIVSRVMKSIDWHIKSIQIQERREDNEAVEAVSKTLGFNLADPKQSIDAVTKTFGIHPAKPKKK